MNAPLVLGCIWVIAAAVTAMLPYRRQFVPGFTLLVLAPVLLIWIGMTQGWLWLVLGLFAFASMFRRPLIHFTRRALRLPADDPRREA
jgi:hypothetical protein